MGENKKHSRLSSKIKFEPQYFIFLFSFAILSIFVIAFARPVFPAPLDETTAPSCTTIVETTPSTNNGTLTPTPTPEMLPPTPEEIGYTNGIIFWATILVIILLVGTLRETLRRKGE